MDEEDEVPAWREGARGRHRHGNLVGRGSGAVAASRAVAERPLDAGTGQAILEWRTFRDLRGAGPMMVRGLAAMSQSRIPRLRAGGTGATPRSP